MSSTFQIEPLTSDCESSITNSSLSSSSSTSFSDCQSRKRIFSEGLAFEISKGERSYELISHRILENVGDNVKIVAVHRKNWPEDSLGQAKVQAFRVYAKALENKHGGGNTNVKFGWYGCDKERIEQILAHGFSYHDLQKSNNHGAILLSHVDSIAQSVKDLDNDEDGLRHVLLCRVLLGRSELVQIGSGQTHPSSTEFDSGVDSYDNPKKYVVWSNNMNTHILPQYVVSFKVKAPQSSSKGVVSRMKNAMRMPTSSRVSFPTLISVLGNKLSPHAFSLIKNNYKNYRDRKISRPELIQNVRQIAGDTHLIDVIKFFKECKDFRNYINKYI